MLPAIVVMGVMGAGKTTLAEKLAAGLSLPFVEGDDLHAPQSRAKLGAGGVAACSALNRQYRDAIRAAAGRDVLFVFLDVPRAELERRLATRSGHFASPALLDSQLATLEPPSADEHAIAVQPDAPLADILARCRTAA
jgi:gluconokinase